MADNLALASTILYIASAVFFVLAVFFFLFFNIPYVIGDLTGANARKAIAKRRAANEKNNARYQLQKNEELSRDKRHDKIEPKKSKKVAAGSEGKKELLFASVDDRPETGLLEDNRYKEAGSSGTETLDKGTDALSSGTDVLMGDGAYETAELTGALPRTPEAPAARKGGVKFSSLDEVILVHTDEVIE